MGHSWGFIFFILGLAGSVILCLVWWCWGWFQHHEEQQNTNLEETILNNISVDHSGQNYETPRIASNKKEALNNEGQVERMVTTFESLSECSLGNYPKL